MENSVELIYLIGYTGKYHDTLHHHPVKKGVLVFCVGSNIVISNLEEIHNQEFLQGGHDEDISLLCLSPSGKYIASAQLGSTKRKGNFATICVWDFYSKKLLFQINGHKNSVHGMSFSHDDTFLATIGDKYMYIWSVHEKGEYAGGQLLRGKGSVIAFSPEGKDFNPNRPTYSIVYADNKVCKCIWKYELRHMQFQMIQQEFKMPGRISGLRRTYTVCRISKDGEYCFFGTRLGEIMIYNNKYNTFDTSLLVVSNGVKSMTLSDSSKDVVEGNSRYVDHKSSKGSAASSAMVYVGGGDGSIKLIEREYDWTTTKELKLRGEVSVLSMDPSKRYLYAGLNSGKMAQVLSETLELQKVLCESHVDEVNSTAISPSCEMFCTCSNDGFLFEWDLSNFSLVHVFRGTGYPTSVAYVSETEILSGWSDGFVRAYDLKEKKLKWKIVNAHQGKVNHVDFNSNFICSGGVDGSIRIWSFKTKELVGQFAEHSRQITGLLIDKKTSYLLHSCGIDKNVFSYNLKVNRRVTYHTPSKDNITCMAQKITGELELVTGSVTGKIMIWDIDYRDPIDHFVVDTGRTRINSVDISRKSGKFLAIGNDKGELYVYDFEKKKVIQKQLAHSKGILKVRWSEDEKQIISVSVDASVCIWNFYQ